MDTVPSDLPWSVDALRRKAALVGLADARFVRSITVVVQSREALMATVTWYVIKTEVIGGDRGSREGRDGISEGVYPFGKKGNEVSEDWPRRRLRLCGARSQLTSGKWQRRPVSRMTVCGACNLGSLE